MDPYQNFTAPYDPNHKENPTNAVGGEGATHSGPYKVQTEWGEKWWDPNADGGAGRWITDPASDGGEDLNRTQQQYGEQAARGNVGPARQYNPAEDAGRYNELSKAQFGSGPQIDMTRPNESRGIGMDALSMLKNRASGAMTPAQQLAADQNRGAVAGVQSNAASVRGGPMARAAAAAGAQNTSAQVFAKGQQDQAALKAREIADASGQYFGAAQGQRGRDLGVATSQADLDAKQRAQNEQRDEFYQGLRYDTQKTAVDDKLGRSDAAANAANAARTASFAEDQARAGRIKDVASATVGGIGGGIDAYQKSQQSGPQKSDDPWDPKNYSSSDPKTKKAVKPVTDAEAKRLKAKGDAMIASNKAQANAQLGKPEEYDGKYFGDIFANAPSKPSPRPAPKLEDTLDERFGAYGDDRGDPYKTPTPPNGATGAPKGYAASRNGEMGSMFGTTMKPGYDLGSGYSDDPNKEYSSKSTVRPENEWAPGSADLYAGTHSRDMSTSDPSAKREAYLLGQQQAHEMRNTGKAPAMPDYVTEANSKSSTQSGKGVADRSSSMAGIEPGRKAVTKSYAKADPEPQRAENRASEQVRDRANTALLMPTGVGTMIGGALAHAQENQYQAARRPAQPGPAAADLVPNPEVMRAMSPRRSVHHVNAESRGGVVPGIPDENMGPSGEGNRDYPDYNFFKSKESPLDTSTALETNAAAITPETEAYMRREGLWTDKTDKLLQDRGVRNASGGGAYGPPRAMTPSDPKSKNVDDEHFGGPMAQANRSMEPSSYEYKPEFARAEGQHEGEKNVGPMADKMESDPVASTAIVKDPRTGLLAIDKTKGLKLVMGGLASLQRQVDRMGGQR